MTPPPAVSEDEFDALDDEYAGFDFDAIPALAAIPSARSPSRSSEYSFESFDDTVLAEFDAIDARENQNACASPVPTAARPDALATVTRPPSPRCQSSVEENDGEESHSNLLPRISI